MCWNEDVSLNTFLFSFFVLFLILYNNTFTKYKIKEFDNKWMYFFIASVSLIQLIEFFTWKNINNSNYNYIFSVCGILLLFTQPIFSIMTLSNLKLRNILLIAYLLLAIMLFTTYKLHTNKIYIDIGDDGHLRWHFIKLTPTMIMIWLFFLLFSFIYDKKWAGLFFGLILLILAVINYKNNNTVWSMWCWAVNSIMIYYACYLLIYLPFLEKRTIC